MRSVQNNEWYQLFIPVSDSANGGMDMKASHDCRDPGILITPTFCFDSTKTFSLPICTSAPSLFIPNLKIFRPFYALILF